jgi:hypothetical protein
MAPLQSGIYIIFDYRGQGLLNPPIGRYPVEDLSLHPKPVYALPGHQGFEMPKWVVEKKDKGYRLKAFGAPVGVHNDRLHAFLMDEKEIEEWCINMQPQHGKDVATIETSDRSRGWCAEEMGEDPSRPRHISVKPLKASRSNPPNYPDTELFTFCRLDKD